MAVAPLKSSADLTPSSIFCALEIGSLKSPVSNNPSRFSGSRRNHGAGKDDSRKEICRLGGEACERYERIQTELEFVKEMLTGDE